MHHLTTSNLITNTNILRAHLCTTMSNDTIQRVRLSTSSCRRSSDFLLKTTADRFWLEAADHANVLLGQVVEFGKQTMASIPHEDQLLLLKNSAFELMALRLSRLYDPKAKMILLGASFRRTTTAECIADDQCRQLVCALLRSLDVLVNGKLTELELALLSALVLLRPDPALRNAQQVERLRHQVRVCLESAVERRSLKPDIDGMMARFVDGTLGDLARMHRQCLEKAKSESEGLEEKLPLLYKELFSPTIA